MYIKKSAVYIIGLTMVLNSCHKTWLDAKSDKNLVTPGSLSDLQALLDNTKMNSMTTGLQQFSELGTDNYYFTYANWLALASGNPTEYNSHIFSKDIFPGQTNVRQWVFPYQRVYYANIVLDELPKINIKEGEGTSRDNLKGAALFFRAYNHFLLQEVFGQPYVSSTAASDLGIPLRLTSDLNEPSKRATVQKTFDQIIEDLTAASTLLPDVSPYKTRPSKAAAFALLSRVYLVTGNYDKVITASNTARALSNTLLDYNTYASSTATYPITRFNSEVLFHDVNNTVLTVTRARVDTLLYQSYAANDLRKKVFFKLQASGNYYSFNGSYDGSTSFWGGIALDEVYLNLAESYARKGNTDSAMANLNALLIKRWKSGMFTSYTATTSSDALNQIIGERRKELLFRGLRWSDLRRLNQETIYQTTVKRLLNGTTYILEPKSIRYAYPIPDDVIALTGMSQNNR